MKFRLSEMAFDEISLVASGDDPEARVVIAKSAPTKKSRVRRNRRSTLSEDDLSQEDQMPDIQKDDLPEDVVTYIEELEKSVDEMVDAIAELDFDEDEIDEDDYDFDEIVSETEDEEEMELAKSDSVTISKAEHATLMQRVEYAEEIAKSERDARLRNEAIAKAEKMSIGTTDEVADLLLALNDADPDLATKVEDLLVSGSAQIDKSALFSEVGKSLAEFTTTSAIDSAVQEIAKANPGMTQEQAFAQAIEANPALYDEYLKEGSR